MYTVIFTNSSLGTVGEFGGFSFRSDLEFWLYNSECNEINLVSGNILNSIVSQYGYSVFTNFGNLGVRIVNEMLIYTSNFALIYKDNWLSVAYDGNIFRFKVLGGIGRLVFRDNMLLIDAEWFPVEKLLELGLCTCGKTLIGNYVGHAGANLVKWCC